MVTRVRTGPTGQPRRRRITCHARPDERGWRCVPMATGFGQRWPLQQPAAPAGSTPVSRGHSACGQEAGLAGGGVAARLGEATRAGHTAPESRDAGAAARARPPALAALAAAAHWQPGPAAAPPEGPGAGAQWPRAPPGVHCGWIAALQAEDPQPWVLVVPLASLCCPPPTTPSSHLAADRRSSHTRGGRNIEVSWPFLVGFSATG